MVNRYINSVSAEDEAAFDKLMTLHPKLFELVSAFKDEPDAFDRFVVMVSDPKLKHSAFKYMH